MHAAPLARQVGALQTPPEDVCPAGQVIGVNTQPVAGAQVSVVHALASSHVIAVCTQVPDTHVSVVHRLVSAHWALVVQPATGFARFNELITSIRP